MNISEVFLPRTNRITATFPAREPLYVYRFLPSLFLAQILFCTLPSAGLLAVGHASVAGTIFWLLFALVLLRTAFLGRRDELLCVLIATAPFVNLFRSYAFYNVILVTFIGILGFYFFSAFSVCKQISSRFKLWWGVLIWSIVYYALSLFNTREYSVNLRLFELTFTIFSLLLIGRNRDLLGATLTGLIISACMVGAAMLPQVGATSERLGIMEADGRMLGNPAQLGLPLAIGFLALIIDRGQWLNLQSKPVLRCMMLVPATALLALTTSRMSWLVAVAGLATLLLVGKRQRRKIVAVALSGIAAIGLVLATPYSGALKKGWERTFGENRSAAKRTSGRSDQWVVSQYAFTRSPNTIIHGYGPGTGAQVYANYSREIPGIKYAVGKKVVLHSLFMQVMVEAGLLGLLFLFGWLLMLSLKLLGRLHNNALIFPLACFAGYMVTVITVSGNDINSGVLLGLALLGTETIRQKH